MTTSNTRKRTDDQQYYEMVIPRNERNTGGRKTTGWTEYERLNMRRQQELLNIVYRDARPWSEFVY